MTRLRKSNGANKKMCLDDTKNLLAHIDKFTDIFKTIHMAKHEAIDTNFFLNRLALEYNCSPASLGLRNTLREVYWFAGPEDFMEMLDDFFTAAMDSNRVWQEGNKPSAGNSVFVIEQIERIIELTYLLREKWKQENNTEKPRTPQFCKDIPKGLPLLLTEAECGEPAMVIQSFFDYLPLPEWKRTLRFFAINALSYSSVTEAIEEQHLFPFTKHLRKLIWGGIWSL